MSQNFTSLRKQRLTKPQYRLFLEKKTYFHKEKVGKSVLVGHFTLVKECNSFENVITVTVEVKEIKVVIIIFLLYIIQFA